MSGEIIYCKWHPTEPISNGTFDAPCGACEGEGEDAARAWEYAPDNPKRSYCGIEEPYPWLPTEPRFGEMTCLHLEDQIPF